MGMRRTRWWLGDADARTHRSRRAGTAKVVTPSTADDRLRADLIEIVTCDFKVDVAEVCGRHGVAPETILRSIPRLRMLEGDGIVRLDGSMLSVNDEFRFPAERGVRVLCDPGQSGRTHSRAV